MAWYDFKQVVYASIRPAIRLFTVFLVFALSEETKFNQENNYLKFL